MNSVKVKEDWPFYSGYKKFGCMFNEYCDAVYEDKEGVIKHLKDVHGWSED